jgi:transposase
LPAGDALRSAEIDRAARHADAASNPKPARRQPHAARQSNWGLLAEYGIIVPLHLHQLRRNLVELTSEPQPELTAFAQELFASLYAELCSVDEQITAMQQRIQRAFQRDAACQKIADVEGGVGPVIATAIVAAIADARHFAMGGS